MVKVVFYYQADNEQMALEEMELHLREFLKKYPDTFTYTELKVTDVKKCDDLPDDWFEDCNFTIETTLTSFGQLSDEELKNLIVDDVPDVDWDETVIIS